MEYAGFWVRFVANLIDSIMIGVAAFGVIFIAGIISSDIVAIFIVLAYVAAFLYWPFMESSESQATLGKRAMGLVVVDAEGKRLTFAHALGRHAGKIVSGLILYIGFLMIGWTDKKQGLHDLMAGTLVIKKGAP